MVDCAQALGLEFGQAALAEADFDRRLQLFDAFNRGFQSVRLGIRLGLALRAGPRPARAEAAPGTERLETERPETEPSDHGREREREDDRDRETVSEAKFLNLLRGVAADAARLPLPPALRGEAATLKGLLAEAGGAPAAPASRSAGIAVLARPPAAKPAPRAALLGSASAPGPLARPRPPPPRRTG